jgi:hypothetical protein
LETSMPSTASVILRFSLQILAATAPHRSTLYTGSAPERVPGYPSGLNSGAGKSGARSTARARSPTLCDRALFEEKIAKLTEQLDSESAARLFAASALRSARQERSARRQEGHDVVAESPSAETGSADSKVTWLKLGNIATVAPDATRQLRNSISPRESG